MIHLVLATHTEAKPIISYFKLKRLMHIYEYQIFINKDKSISLTISGIGKVFSACSVIFTYSLFKRQRNNIWINIGIAGHNDLKIGEIILVNKINDLSSKKSWYPSIVFNHAFKVQNCNTYDKPNFKYTKNLHDMELSGFYSSANKLSYCELIQSLKIVSDNKEKKINFKEREKISELIKINITKIEEVILILRKLYSKIN